MRAVLLVGHGSLRRGAGAAMIRLAARARAAGIAPIVGSSFLGHCRPGFAEALARCVQRGADEVVVQPYFLTPVSFVHEELEQLIAAGRAAHPAATLLAAQPFGDHPALADLVLKRAAEADYLADRPWVECGGAAAGGPDWFLGQHRREAGLLLMAHGSESAPSNRPIYAVAGRVRAARRHAHVVVGFMQHNRPSIAGAIDWLVAAGVSRIIALPYFLHLGRHVAADLPALIAQAQARHPRTAIVLAEHLAYDRLLVRVIATRVSEALALGRF